MISIVTTKVPGVNPAGIVSAPKETTIALLSAGGTGDGHSLDASDGSPADVVYVDSKGDVGIGVINPIARYDQTSPIYGMPILDADKAKHIIIIKRSLNPGFAGIDNELFYDAKTSMYFGSAREKVQELVSEVKKL